MGVAWCALVLCSLCCVPSKTIQDLELASKSKELAQQSGIIDYINKLSSNAAAEAAAAEKSSKIKGHKSAAPAAPTAAVVSARDAPGHGVGGRATQVPDSEGHQF